MNRFSLFICLLFSTWTARSTPTCRALKTREEKLRETENACAAFLITVSTKKLNNIKISKEEKEYLAILEQANKSNIDTYGVPLRFIFTGRGKKEIAVVGLDMFEYVKTTAKDILRRERRERIRESYLCDLFVLGSIAFVSYIFWR